MENHFEHIPVLYREVGDLFDFQGRPAKLIDGTLGFGGHSALLLERNPQLRILGIDRDMAAMGYAKEKLAFAADRVVFAKGDFSSLAELAVKHGFTEADGILLDIGVSSLQLDDGSRGFSWRFDGPLDMRMDRDSEVTASRILNRASEEELSRIFRDYGEIKAARKLARAVVGKRVQKPFAVTGQLVDLCDEVLGKARGGRLPAPTLAFQALRIAVNDELGELDKALHSCVGVLKEGGIFAVITFHSLEDRMVKHFFREESKECVCPPGLPVCACDKQASLKVLTAHPICAGEDELQHNRRAASAKLRAAQKILTTIAKNGVQK